jgi:nicotinamide-nucleotide amidase
MVAEDGTTASVPTAKPARPAGEVGGYHPATAPLAPPTPMTPTTPEPPPPASAPLRAAVVAVGSELLSTDRLDTNSLRLAELFERHGVALVRKAAVGDDEREIAAEIAHALARAEVVVVTGGLGPTADDVTREGVAAALGRGLEESEEVWASIERRFAAIGRVPSANNRRQALVIDGAEALSNDRGSAPGLRLDDGARTLFLLPGPPHELEAMVERELAPWLVRRAAASGGNVGAARERRTLRIAMRPESEIDRALEPAYAEFGREWLTVLAAPGEVQVRVVASGPEAERRLRLERMALRVRELLGDAIYAEGEATTLERTVVEALDGRGLTVATAESCTGGLLAERLTRVAGSSRVFPGGAVVYSNAAKSRQLGVEAALIAEHGAVSEPVARALARAARERFDADFGVGVTGVAGPDGGSPEKPVGTVHLAVDGGGRSDHRRLRLPGDRERVRWQATQAALEMLRRRLADSVPQGAT